MPPQGVSGRPVAAQLEVRILGAGEFRIDPSVEAMEPTEFPAPGAPGGPSFKVKLTNISPLPLAISLRLTGLEPALDDAVTVRGSGAHAVLVNGTLGAASSWTAAGGNLPSGATTTLRFRFKLKPGLTPDAYSGRVDVRQLELKGVPLAAGGTTPAVMPGTTPTVAAPLPSTPPATTPQPVTGVTTPSGPGD